MSVCKNPSQFQTTAFLLVNIHVLIGFYTMAFLEKDTFNFGIYLSKVHIFWEDHKILRNLHRRFDRSYIGQIYGGNFENISGVLRIYEL